MFGDVWIDDLGDRRSRRRRIAHSGWDEASTKRWDRFSECIGEHNSPYSPSLTAFGQPYSDTNRRRDKDGEGWEADGIDIISYSSGTKG